METETRPDDGATNEYQRLFSGLAGHQQEPKGSLGSADAMELSPMIAGASTTIGIASHNRSPAFNGECVKLELANSELEIKNKNKVFMIFMV